MLGTLFEIVHAILDIAAFFGIFFEIAKNILLGLLTLILYLLTYLYTFFASVAVFTFTYEEAIGFDSRVLAFVNAIPLFSTLTLLIVVAFYVLLLFKIFKILSAEA